MLETVQVYPEAVHPGSKDSRGALRSVRAAHESPYRLLLVEDNAADARLVRELLRDQPDFPHELVHVERLAAARRRLSSYGTDVVILDLKLPDSDGLETVEAILDCAPEVATVVLSGRDDAALSADAVRRGAQDYLLKAELQTSALVRAIRYAHERKSRENERVRTERELSLLNRLTREIAEASDFDEALELLLDEVCRTIGWVTGESWIPSPTGDRLVRGPVSTVNIARYRRFHTASEQFEFRPGVGMPGEVWQKREPLWEPDLDRSSPFMRGRLAAEVGLNTVMMLPVLAGDTVAAVLAFYDTRRREEDRRQIHLLTAVTAQLGTVLRRRRAEVALRESEAWRRQLMDNATEGIAVLTPDARIQYVNQRAAALISTTPDELVGRSVFDVVRPDVAGEIVRGLRHWRRGRQGTAEVRLRSLDGEERWILVSGSPVAGEHGRYGGALLMLTDITQLKKTEQIDRILADSGQPVAWSGDPAETVRRLAGILVPSLADCCVVALVDSGELRITALEAADPEQKALLEETLGTSPRALEDEAEQIQDVLRSGKPLLLTRTREELASNRRHRGGRRCLLSDIDPVSTVIVPLATSNGTLGVLILCTAESERLLGEKEMALAVELGRRAGLALENARLYQEATEAVRARDDLLGIVAHDLRNPLGAIAMYASMIQEDVGTEETRKNWVYAIRRSVEHMDHLIQDLLDVTRLEAGRLSIHKEPAKISGVLSEIREMFGSTASQHGIAYSVEPVGGSGVAEGWLAVDRNRLIQILSNLVGNALKFTPAGGSVEVKVEPDATGYHFWVADTGPGLSEEQRARVFDRFWQAANAPRSGAGLGLTIAKGLVEAHGGRIWVDSTPGAGSTFHFTIQAQPAETEAEEATSLPTHTLYPAAPRPELLRVLIVDDHEIFLSSLEEILRSAGGYDVVGKAHTAEEALERAHLLRPDLILMDLEMPGRGGIWAIQEFAAEEKRIPVVVLTGDAEEKTLAAAVEAGASGFVRKNEKPQKLLDAIETVARGGIGLDPSAHRLLAELLRRKLLSRSGDPLKGLTEQERQIVMLVAEGYTSKEIGKRLFLSAKTVDSYRSRIMRSLGLRHRSDLVRLAIQAGLLHAEPLAD